MNYYSKYITDLDNDEVWVFGSNTLGFHGCGSAGYASFGVFGNRWREFDYANKPDGWKGKWNVKGVSEGLQEGEEGKSYAIITVTKPGAKRSISKKQIKQSVIKFYRFAESNPNLKFYVAQSVTPGYNGYSVEEMMDIWSVEYPPDNVYFYEPFYELLKDRFPLLNIFDAYTHSTVVS
jgi:hypothetical protein